MKKVKSVSYKVVLRNKRGGFASLARAFRFQIFFGKKKIAEGNFGRIKTAASKRRKVTALVNEIETARQAILAKRRRKKARELRKREEEFRQAQRRVRTIKQEQLERAEKREQIEKVLPANTFTDSQFRKMGSKIKFKLSKAERGVVSSLKEQNDKEIADFNSAREEYAQTLKQIAIDEVLVIPLIPESGAWKKEYIYKNLVINGDRIPFAIFNLSLPAEEEIPVMNENIIAALRETFLRLGYHLFMFFEENKKFNDLFILRLKFRWEHQGSTIEQGISMNRMHIESWEEMKNLFMGTFLKLKGMRDDEINHRTKNYLLGDQMIFITGFTLEASSRKDVLA